MSTERPTDDLDGAALQPTNDWPVIARSISLVLVSFAGGLILLYGVVEHGPVGLWRWVDIGFGAVASFALLLRRRAPLIIAIALAFVAAVFATGGVANMLALYAVARRRSLSVALAVAAVNVAAGCAFVLLYPQYGALSLTLTVNTAIAAAVTAWGARMQSQEALVDSYRERADRVEREQIIRETEVRYAERDRIAREMHDAVAHRISLVALHAGGLAVAPEPSRADVRGAAELIRSAATQALDELRDALGVLHAGEQRSLEQPGLDRIEDLIRDARVAGQRVEMHCDSDLVGFEHRADGPPATSRAAYRIVQEGLTNARKHAPGAPVSVSLHRTNGQLHVEVDSAMVSETLGVPGSGRGLIGLTERATLAGGTLHHGVTDAGRFALQAELPWT